MIRAGFTAKCQICEEVKTGCACCAILGTNAFQDKEWNFFDAVCAECRRRAWRVWLHVRHQNKRTRQ